MKHVSRWLAVAALAATVSIASSPTLAAKKPAATPAPSATAPGPGAAAPSGAAGPAASPAAGGTAGASASPGPLPTATPEPPTSAIPRLEAKVKANPNDRQALGDLAGYYLQVGRPDLALALTQRLVALGVKNAQVYYLDGVSNQELGRRKEATADFEQAANLEPTNSAVLQTLTSLYLDANRPADAERIAKRATTFNPTDKRSFENYGQVLLAERKFDDARAQFEAAAKLDAKDPEPVILEAQSYLRQDALALAGQLFERALTIDPKNGDALLGKARLLAAEHNVKDSIATYEQLYPQLPSDDAKAALIIEEARVYAQEKMQPELQAALKRGLDTFPKVAAVHIADGDYLAGQKDSAGAEREWNAAAGPARDNAEAMQRLGDLYTASNRQQQAVGAYKRLTELVPNNPSAFAEYGQSLAVRHQFDKARDAYRRSFEIGHAPAALAGLGASDYEQHNFKECSQVFDAIDRGAAAYLRQNPQLYLVMGNCYKSTNQKDKARSAYTRLLALVKPNTPAHADIQKLVDATSGRPAASPTRPAPRATPKH